MERFKLVFATVVTVVWAISFTADVVMPRYEMPPSVHGAILLVAGALFGSSVVNRNGDK